MADKRPLSEKEILQIINDIPSDVSEGDVLSENSDDDFMPEAISSESSEVGSDSDSSEYSHQALDGT